MLEKLTDKLVNDELRELAAILADWISPTSCTLYLYGSRVRGDHRPDSDVDVVISWDRPVTDGDIDWHNEQETTDHREINSRLAPGKIHIQELNERVAETVIEAGRKPVYRDRNVVCVYLPPKRGTL